MFHRFLHYRRIFLLTDHHHSHQQVSCSWFGSSAVDYKSVVDDAEKTVSYDALPGGTGSKAGCR